MELSLDRIMTYLSIQDSSYLSLLLTPSLKLSQSSSDVAMTLAWLLETFVFEGAIHSTDAAMVGEVQICVSNFPGLINCRKVCMLIYLTHERDSPSSQVELIGTEQRSEVHSWRAICRLKDSTDEVGARSGQ
mgnify:CR=1 FL=1